MKTVPTHIVGSALGLTLLLLNSGCMASAPSVAQSYAHSVNFVARNSSATITRGSTRDEVVQLLGEPGRRLTDAIWIYRNFDAGFEQSVDDDCHTLAITFEDDSVSGLKLINGRAERILAAQVERWSNRAGQVAAK